MWRRWGSGANSSSISAWSRSRGSRNCRSTTIVAATGVVGALWLAAAAAVGTAAVGAAAAGIVGAVVVGAGSGPELDPLARGGEEWRTRGLKLCPPCVLTMPGVEKGRRWREWEEEDLK